MFTVDSIRERLAPVFQQYDVKSATLFGSYAKGTADERSDVDLVVDTNLGGLRFMSLYVDMKEALDDIDLDMFPQYDVIPGGRADQEVKRWGVQIYGT